MIINIYKIILNIVIQLKNEVFPGLIPDVLEINDLPQSCYPALEWDLPETHY